MNVGDKVRMLTDSGEGIISRIIDAQTVEVEIEDGFQIPVLKREVVVVSKSEAKYFGDGVGEPVAGRKESATTQAAKGLGKDKSAKPVQRAVLAAKGIYLAFVPLNDQNLAVYLVNNTDYTLPFSVAEERAGDLHGMEAGVIQAGSSHKLRERSLVNFDKWPDLVIQWLYHRHGIFSMKEATQKRFKAKASTFYRNKRTAPLLEQDAYLFQIDQDVAVKEVNPENIKEAMLAPKSGGGEASKAAKRPAGGGEQLVDLHIETLVPDKKSLSNAEMLEVQLHRFEETLDQAISAGVDHITFIHGVGNGVLRDALHKRLAKAEHIQFFEDAMKDKFGYGATRVQIQ